MFTQYNIKRSVSRGLALKLNEKSPEAFRSVGTNRLPDVFLVLLRKRTEVGVGMLKEAELFPRLVLEFSAVEVSALTCLRPAGKPGVN